ncbi:hypothetical protein B0H16DRAFT_1522878 [Mycena metata]|uniref:MYND-type domain-containing protein n=1 Tax=Mycena metata TaxID=1033252 RepID=A0AAD7JJ98_9AGAR|nr:hypothetical protein B0H16DRAFT_1522878 [Mycena metata]
MDYCDAGCGKPGEMRCSGCKILRYCGSECQKKDWKAHKLDCKTLARTGKPRTTHCTGCKLPFGLDEYIGRSMGTCPDCGYTGCEMCITHNCLGTCYCPESNFGRKYCKSVPEWYHYAGRTRIAYRGDNHPEIGDAKGHGVPSAQWEDAARACGNCGKHKVCLKPGYICSSSLCR